MSEFEKPEARQFVIRSEVQSAIRPALTWERRRLACRASATHSRIGPRLDG